MLEAAVVAGLLAIAPLLSGRPVEALAAAAVLLSFMHAQVAERLADAESRRLEQAVACHQWAGRYFAAKEVLWVSYFAISGAWSALVGCGVFLAYPAWRRWYRAREPRV